MALYTSKDGVVKELSELHTSVDGVVMNISEMHTGVDGVVKQIYSSSIKPQKYILLAYVQYYYETFDYGDQIEKTNYYISNDVSTWNSENSVKCLYSYSSKDTGWGRQTTTKRGAIALDIQALKASGITKITFTMQTGSSGTYMYTSGSNGVNGSMSGWSVSGSKSFTENITSKSGQYFFMCPWKNGNGETYIKDIVFTKE